MSDQINFNLVGVDGVVKRLRELGPKLQKKGLRAAARKAANIIRDSAREKAKTFDDPGTGNQIYKNIVTQESSKRSRKVGGIVMRVGVMGGAFNYANTKQNKRLGRVGKKFKTLGSKKNPGGDTWYWRFKEFGTESQAADPFLRPALSGNIEKVTSVFTSEIKNEIEKLTQGNS